MNVKIISITETELATMLRLAAKEGANEALQIVGEAKEKETFKTVKQTCELLKISRDTLYKLTNTGILPRQKMGGRVLYKMSDILKCQNHAEA